MNKKIGLSLLVLLISNLFLIGFISAYGGFGGIDLRSGSEQVINGAVDFAEPFLQALLGGDSWSGYFLFEKLVLFLILASIVYLSISKIKPFKDNNAIIWIITLAIPLLGVRWMDYAWLNSIMLQYQVLGIVITSILPFIIYFLFLEGLDYGSIRKIGWILFVIIYYGLWSTTSDNTYGQYYLWTLFAGIILLFFDGTIHRYYIWEKLKVSGKNSVEQAATAIRRKMFETKQDLERKIITDETYNDLMKRLEKDLKALYKHSF